MKCLPELFIGFSPRIPFCLVVFSLQSDFIQRFIIIQMMTFYPNTFSLNAIDIMLRWSTNIEIFGNLIFSIRLLLTVGCHDVGLDSSAVIFIRLLYDIFITLVKIFYYVFHFTKYLPSCGNDKIVNNSPPTCSEWMLFKMWYQQWLVHISPHCVSARAWNVISYWEISQTLTIFI